MIALSISSISGASGDTVALDLSIASTGGDQCTDIQWTLSYNSDLILTGVDLGPVGVAAVKILSRNLDLCLVYGLNTTAIADGVLATLTFRISPFLVGTSATVTPTSIVASDADANTLDSSGSAGTVTFVGGGTGTLPCENVTERPTTDNSFRLEKVMAALKESTHIPVRGSTI